MNACHMLAGKDPPVTRRTPPTSFISTRPSGEPIQTAVDSSFVYPTNQASEWSWVVPVLPAAGRPSGNLARVPVPRCTLSARIDVTFLATPSSRTRWPSPGPVLANYGLENLRFVKPVYAGDTIRARLTCKQKTAKDTVRKLFKDDFAARKDSVKRALAWRLFEQAKSSRDDIKMRYALLTEAIQLAVGNRDVAAILTFTDELAGGFDGVDATAEKRTQLTKIKTDLTATAVLKLLDDPRDPAANAVVGKYFCLSADNWSVGLPLLALGGDQALAKIAGMEIANPSAAPQQMELADAWHAQGGSRNEQQIAAWTRAAMWYRKALPSLTGVSKERVEQTLDSLFPTVIPPDFKWEAITDKQWDKLKAPAIAVSAVKPKTDSGVVLNAGERARVVPHPSDTWMFNSWWTDGQIAVGWRGEQYKSATGVIYTGSSRMVGQLMAWTKEGDQKPPGIISGPGKLILGPNESGYAVKGAIRVKVIVLDE